MIWTMVKDQMCLYLFDYCPVISCHSLPGGPGRPPMPRSPVSPFSPSTPNEPCGPFWPGGPVGLPNINRASKMSRRYYPAGNTKEKFFVVLPGKPGNPLDPGSPGDPGGPGIALQGPEKQITETQSSGQHRGCM